MAEEDKPFWRRPWVKFQMSGAWVIGSAFLIWYYVQKGEAGWAAWWGFHAGVNTLAVILAAVDIVVDYENRKRGR